MGGDEGDEENEENEEHGITVEDDSRSRPGETKEEAKGRRRYMKAKLKSRFNKSYDKKGNMEEKDETYFDLQKKANHEQAEKNETEFANDSVAERMQFLGARPGVYVRVVLVGVPCELTKHWQPNIPLILGGLLPNEQNLGFVTARVKKHRWTRKVLKTNNPLVFSIGWRRFQSMPIYAIEDHNKRLRFLKYTPMHMHCIATFYGPLCPPSTGVMAFINVSSKQLSFRVSINGSIVEMDQSVQIVKKLKLTGTPIKIFKNTAYIRGMFNSSLEAAKFEGAKIRTVSGIRGLIKKAVLGKDNGPKGSFRAGFEDKILMSDIVFCRTWVAVTPKQYYNPVTSLLVDANIGWSGMRTVVEIRRDRNIPIPYKKDSEYREIKREARRFNPLVIPKSLQAQLPFKSKPKLIEKRSDKQKLFAKKRTVVLTTKEKRSQNLIMQLNTVRSEKIKTETKIYRANEKKTEESSCRRGETQRTKQREKKETLCCRRQGKDNQTPAIS